MAAAPDARPGRSQKDYVPDFLLKLGIAPGIDGWFRGSKPTIRALMRPSWALKVRIWACLIVHSFGYDADLAIFAKGETDRPGGLPTVKPLMPHQIATELNKATVHACKESNVALSAGDRTALKISKAHLRRALADLEEDDGLIVRTRWNRDETGTPARSHGGRYAPSFWNLAGLSLDEAIAKNAVTPLSTLTADELKRAGKICVYVRALPRPAQNIAAAIAESLQRHSAEKVAKFDIGDSPEQLVLPLSRLIQRFRSSRPAILQRPDVAAWLDAGQNLIEKVRREAAVSNDPPTGRKSGETGSVPNPILRAEPPNTRHSAPPVHEAAEIPADRRTLPASRVSDAASPVSAVANPQRNGRPDEQTNLAEDQKTPPRASAAAESIYEGIPDADISLVRSTMRLYCPHGVAKILAVDLIAGCREHQPSATAVMIAEGVHIKGAYIKAKPRKFYNPPAFLAQSVPELFDVPPPADKSARELSAEVEASRALHAAELETARRIVAGEYDTMLDKHGKPVPGLITAEEREWARELVEKEGGST